MPETPTVAMILAAGFGTRMAPLSRGIPKALLPVMGRPLLEWVLRHLATQGVTRTVVNVHHLSQPVIEWSERHAGSPFDAPDGRRLLLPAVHVIAETEILGTGGGIANAASLLTSDPVLIHNVDLLLRFDLEALLDAHRRGAHAATLVLVRDPEHAQIAVSDSRVARIESRPDPSASDLWCFSGVSLLSQEAIGELPRGGFVELTPHLRRWTREGRLGAHFEPAPFLEVGTIESYLEVNRELASQATDRYLTGSPPAELLRPGPESVFAPDARIGSGADIRASVGLRGAIVPADAHVDRVVVGSGSLPERASVGSGSLPERASVGSGSLPERASVGSGSLREREDADFAEPRKSWERIVSFAGEVRPIRVLSAEEEVSCHRFLEQHAALLEGYATLLERHAAPPTSVERPFTGETPAGSNPTVGARSPNRRTRLRLMHGDGSRRRILRVIAGGATQILVLNPPAPESSNYPRRAGGPDENETFCYVAEHLQRLGVRVPRIDAFDKSEGILLLEDLGATRLADLEPTRVDDRPSAFAASLPATVETSSASKRRSPHSDDAAGVDRFEKAYLEAVEVLARIQSPGTESFDPQRTFNPAYDPAFVLRYEVDYFYREVAERYAGLGPASPELRAEFTAIAERAGNPPERVLMHRDYQSRNLMVTREGIAVIDFQGARLGPPAYDLASLLLDPYSELGSLRDRLFDHYLRVTGRGVEFRESFPHVALARLLQALGAFGYLGGTLGKPGYLEHVPRALSRVASLAAPIYPRLAELAITIAETWGQPSR